MLLLMMGLAAAAELPLTLVDAPHNLRGPGTSMQQSLELSYSLQRLGLLGTQAAATRLLPERPFWRTTLGLGIATALPQLGVTTWMHEEWHRAPMSQYGLSNRNTYYAPETWEMAAAGVDQMTDRDLAWLKREHPADLVRAHAAGLESEHALVRFAGDQLLWEADQHLIGPLYTAGSWMAPTLITAEVDNFGYLVSCGPPSNYPPEDENEPREDLRDFTGWDCDAWAYDLVLPDEAYEARGVHPAGQGVDRYRVWADLPTESREVLRRVTRLYWINALNPHLYGINAIAVGEHRMNFATGLVLTPSGYAIDGSARLLAHERMWTVDVSTYVSRALVRPGVSLGVERWPLTDRLRLDVQLSWWMQPENLRWDDTRAAHGGRVAMALRYDVSSRVGLRAEGMAKSQGWVLGEASLEPGGAVRLGVDFRL